MWVWVSVHDKCFVETARLTKKFAHDKAGLLLAVEFAILTYRLPLDGGLARIGGELDVFVLNVCLAAGKVDLGSPDWILFAVSRQKKCLADVPGAKWRCTAHHGHSLIQIGGATDLGN